MLLRILWDSSAANRLSNTVAQNRQTERALYLARRGIQPSRATAPGNISTTLSAPACLRRSNSFPPRGASSRSTLLDGRAPAEVLALTPASFQVESAIVANHDAETAAARVRERSRPVSMAALDQYFDVAAAQRSTDQAGRRLWPWCRVTAWRHVKALMYEAGVVGRQACPRGLRHAFGVGVLQAGVPLNLAQRWLGHARLSTTAIYADACGPDEVALAARFWDAVVNH